MSTYYAFYCSQCKQQGGFLTRQAWGCGNFNIVETFKFVMYHSLECGPESVRMCSEHSDKFGYPETPMDRMAHIFPSSNDWTFVAERIQKDTSWRDTKREWHKNNRKEDSE